MFGEVLSLALVVAVSPLSIVPALLIVLHSSRPRPTGLAYFIGWLIGLEVVTAGFLATPKLFGGLDGTPSSWGTWARITVGVVLIGLAVWRWLTRRAADHAPAFLNGVSTLRPARAAAVGFALTVVNPKVLLVTAAAGIAIGTADVGVPLAWAAVTSYALVASSTVAIPVLVYAAAPDRFDRPLEGVRQWMESRYAILTAAILAVVGIVLLIQGTRQL